MTLRKTHFTLRYCLGKYFQNIHLCEASVNQPIAEQEHIEEKQIFAVTYFSRKWALPGWLFLARVNQGGSQDGERQMQVSTGRPSGQKGADIPGRTETGQWERKAAWCWASAQHPWLGPGSSACRSRPLSRGLKNAFRLEQEWKGVIAGKASRLG